MIPAFTKIEALIAAEHALSMMLSYHGQGQQEYADYAQTKAVEALAMVTSALERSRLLQAALHGQKEEI